MIGPVDRRVRWAYRVGASSLLVSLAYGWGGKFGIGLALQSVSPFTPEGWTGPWSSTVVPLMAWLTLIAGTVGVLLVPGSRLVQKCFGTLFFACAVVNAVCYPSLADAAWYGGIWTGAWWMWFSWRSASEPASAHRDALFVFSACCMALFLPASVGKWMDSWISGEVFAHMLWWTQHVAKDATSWAQIRPWAQLYAWLGILVEGILGLAPMWLALTSRVRWVLPGTVLLTTVVMMTTWEASLVVVLGPIAGLSIAVWLVDGAPTGFDGQRTPRVSSP